MDKFENGYKEVRGWLFNVSDVLVISSNYKQYENSKLHCVIIACIFNISLCVLSVLLSVLAYRPIAIVSIVSDLMSNKSVHYIGLRVRMNKLRKC